MSSSQKLTGNKRKRNGIRNMNTKQRKSVANPRLVTTGEVVDFKSLQGDNYSGRIEFTKQFLCIMCGKHKEGENLDYFKIVNSDNFFNFPFMNPNVFKTIKTKNKKKSIKRICRCCVDQHNNNVEEKMKKDEENVRRRLHISTSMYIKELKKKEEELLSQKLEFRNQQQSIDLEDEVIVHRIAEKIKQDCLNFIKTEKKTTLIKLGNFDMEKERKKKKNMLLSRVLNIIAEEKKKNLKDISINNIDLMVESIMSILLKLNNLKYNSKHSFMVSLLLHQFGNSDIVETIVNRCGLGLSPTKNDDFLNKESKKTRKIKKPKKTGLAVVQIWDNAQKVEKKRNSSRTQDLKSNTVVVTNYGYFSTNYSLDKLDKIKLVINKEDIDKLKFENSYSEDDSKHHLIFMKNEFENLKSLLCLEKKHSGEDNDIVTKFCKEIKNFENKICPKKDCGKSYGNKKFKCECGAKLLTVSQILNKRKEYEIEKIEELKHLELKESKKMQNSINNSDIHITKCFNGNPSALNDVQKLIKYGKKLIRNTKQINNIHIVDGSPNVIITNQKVIGNPEFDNVVSKNGCLHTMQESIRNFFDIIKETYPEVFKSLGYKTQKSIDFIASVGDLHKATEIVFLIFEVVMKEFIIDCSKHSEIAVEDLLFDYFYTYCKEENGYLFFLLHESSLIKMMKVGIRTANFNYLQSSTRLIDNILFTKPRQTYPKIRLMDEIFREAMKNRGETEFLDFLNQIQIMKTKDGSRCRTSDGRIEEKNRDLKSLVGNPTLTNWIRSSILFEDLMKIKNKGFKLFNLRDRSREVYQVSHVLDKLLFAKNLRENKKVLKSFNFQTIDSNKSKISGNGFQKFNETLLDRKRNFYKKMKGFLKEKKTPKLEKINNMPFKFVSSYNFIVEEEDEEDSDFIFDDKLLEDDDEEIIEQTNTPTTNNSNEPLFHAERKESIYLNQKEINKIEEAKKKGFISCCKGICCSKKIKYCEGVGYCYSCKCFFQDNSCGQIFDEEICQKRKPIRMYCKKCILKSECAFCQKKLTVETIDLCMSCKITCFCIDCGKKNSSGVISCYKCCNK